MIRYTSVVEYLRGSLGIETVKSSLVAHIVWGTTSLVLLKLQLGQSAGVVLASRLGFQSLLQTILGLAVVDAFL